MRPLRLSLLSIVVAGSAVLCAQPRPEADVYAALREARYHGVLGNRMVVIDRTIAMPRIAGSSPGWLDQFDAIPVALRRTASQTEPSKVVPLDSALFAPGTKLVSQAGIDAIFQAEGINGWKGFVSKYGAEGYLSFSEVLFTPDRLDALVYYEASCGGLCGEGGYAWLHRDNDRARWSLMKKIVSWMA
jgi:hypothetical protein